MFSNPISRQREGENANPAAAERYTGVLRYNKNETDKDKLPRLINALSKKAKKINEAMAARAVQESTEHRVKNVDEFYRVFGSGVELYEIRFTDIRPIGNSFTRLYTGWDLMMRFKMIADAKMSETFVTTVRKIPSGERDAALKQAIGKTVNSRHPYTPCICALLYRVDPSGPVELARGYLASFTDTPIDVSRCAYYDRFPPMADPVRYFVSLIITAVDAPSRVCLTEPCVHRLFGAAQAADINNTGRPVL